MDTTQLSPMVKLAITAAALYGAYHYGPNWMKGLAIGAAGFVALNQVPVIRDGMAVRLVA